MHDPFLIQSMLLILPLHHLVKLWLESGLSIYLWEMNWEVAHKKTSFMMTKGMYSIPGFRNPQIFWKVSNALRKR